MNELRALLEGMIGGEGDYFRSLVWGSDRNTFVVSLDEVEETPCVGCLVSRDSDVDVVGSVRWRFALFFLIKRDEEATSEEWDMAQSELAKELHCFCARLRPYVLRYPSSFSHWSDHALSGYWCEMVASATSVGECVDCTPPEPAGEFVDYLHALNGRNHYSQYILPYFNFPVGWRIEVDHERGNTRCWSFSRQNNTIFPWTGTSVSADARILTKIYILATNGIRREDTHEGDIVYSAETEAHWGETGGSLFRLFISRNQDNITNQKIYSVKIYNADNLEADLRPYRLKDGTPGLKDLVTGAFHAPQHNEGITAVKEED